MILVKDNKVILIGYNGLVLGIEYCIDYECLVIEGYCVCIFYVEVNVIF